MSEPTLETAVVQSEELLASAIDDEVVLMSIGTGTYYSFAGVGDQIWSLMEEPTTIEDICRELGKKYEVEPSTCEQEVLAFVQHLISEQIVVVQ